MQDSDSIFLTPRVIDQKGIEQLVASLRELVSSARDESRSLREAMDDATEKTGESLDTARQLHERLNLGARMLKAFQAQIDRVDSLLVAASEQESEIAKLNESLDERTADFESALEKYIKTFESRLKDLSDRAAKRYEKQLAKFDTAIADIEPRLESCEQRFAKFDERASELEEKLQQTDSQREIIVRETSRMAREANVVCKNIDEARSGLQKDLAQASDEITTFDRTARDVQQRLDNLLATCTTRLDALDAREVEAERALDQLDARIESQIKTARTEVQGTLEKEITRSITALRAMADRAEAILQIEHDSHEDDATSADTHLLSLHPAKRYVAIHTPDESHDTVHAEGELEDIDVAAELEVSDDDDHAIDLPEKSPAVVTIIENPLKPREATPGS